MLVRDNSNILFLIDRLIYFFLVVFIVYLYLDNKL